MVIQLIEGESGEDDNMHAHIIRKHLKVERPPVSVAHYKILKHTNQNKILLA
jgi:hypothetical protein